MTWFELKPVIRFLAVFLLFYLVANLLYGLWITSYEPMPDPMTMICTRQSALIISAFGSPVQTITSKVKPTEKIVYNQRSILAVYEGCNGINVWIIFAGFLIAFSTINKRMLSFLLAGTLIIHVVNLARIVALFFISVNYPGSLYFFHKYMFTAVLYLVVFAMWYFWISNGKDRRAAA